MRDRPAVYWMLGCFIFGCLGIGVYARTGPEKLPAARSAWEHVEHFRDELEYRRTNLSPGGKRDLVVPPYKITFRRLTDLRDPELTARYLVHLVPIGKMPMDRPFIGAGADVAMVDSRPTASTGFVRIVMFQRAEQPKE